MHFAQTLKRSAAVSGTAILATFALGLTSAPAHAGAIVPGVSIGVDGYGGGHGSVAGTAAGYTAVLTAVGGGTCALANAVAPVYGAGIASGNPAKPNTPGAVCHLYDATIHYTLVATPLVGSPITFYRTCVWELGKQICTPEGADLV